MWPVHLQVGVNARVFRSILELFNVTQDAGCEEAREVVQDGVLKMQAVGWRSLNAAESRGCMQQL